MNDEDSSTLLLSAPVSCWLAPAPTCEIDQYFQNTGGSPHPRIILQVKTFRWRWKVVLQEHGVYAEHEEGDSSHDLQGHLDRP